MAGRTGDPDLGSKPLPGVVGLGRVVRDDQRQPAIAQGQNSAHRIIDGPACRLRRTLPDRGIEQRQADGKSAVRGNLAGPEIGVGNATAVAPMRQLRFGRGPVGGQGRHHEEQGGAEIRAVVAAHDRKRHVPAEPVGGSDGRRHRRLGGDDRQPHPIRRRVGLTGQQRSRSDAGSRPQPHRPLSRLVAANSLFCRPWMCATSLKVLQSPPQTRPSALASSPSASQ